MIGADFCTEFVKNNWDFHGFAYRIRIKQLGLPLICLPNSYDKVRISKDSVPNSYRIIMVSMDLRTEFVQNNEDFHGFAYRIRTK